MKTNILVALILGLIGIVFLAGGAAASINTVSNTVNCEVCGMTISKTDISTIQVVTPDGVTHWACSPICAAELAIYYQNDVINAKCYVSGRTIQINVVNGSITSVLVTPSSPQDNVQVVSSGDTMTSKFVSTSSYANQLLQTFSSNPNATILTLQQTFMMAQNMLAMKTPSYSAVQIPTLNYALMITGGILFAAAPVSWSLLKKRTTP
ncbi:MAG TPA: hypothetical protein VMD05_11240 [Candidatus Nanoarchaeia archaeon]|nr:hypothetical protein [Candidatus Nanoarchaeia archaeon]